MIWTLPACQTPLPPQGLCTCCLTNRFPSHLSSSFSVQRSSVKTQELNNRAEQYLTRACMLCNFISVTNKKKESAWKKGKLFLLWSTGSGGSTEECELLLNDSLIRHLGPRLLSRTSSGNCSLTINMVTLSGSTIAWESNLCAHL